MINFWPFLRCRKTLFSNLYKKTIILQMLPYSFKLHTADTISIIKHDNIVNFPDTYFCVKSLLNLCFGINWQLTSGLKVALNFTLLLTLSSASAGSTTNGSITTHWTLVSRSLGNYILNLRQGIKST